MPSKPVLKARYQSIGTSFFASYMFVMIPGVIGYLIFGKSCQPVIFDSFPDNDVLMIISTNIRLSRVF